MDEKHDQNSLMQADALDTEQLETVSGGRSTPTLHPGKDNDSNSITVGKKPQYIDWHTFLGILFGGGN